MPVMGFTKFERFFRAAGGVDVDRDDIKRYLDFVNDALYDLLLIGQATAKANVRDVILPGTCRSQGPAGERARLRAPRRGDRTALPAAHLSRTRHDYQDGGCARRP
jgi:hypothetical protein